ncbi:MAG: hypothetical protein ACI8UC_000385, partial [Psychromonas sp.]
MRKIKEVQNMELEDVYRKDLNLLIALKVLVEE